MLPLVLNFIKRLFQSTNKISDKILNGNNYQNQEEAKVKTEMSYPKKQNSWWFFLIISGEKLKNFGTMNPLTSQPNFLKIRMSLNYVKKLLVFINRVYKYSRSKKKSEKIHQRALREVPKGNQERILSKKKRHLVGFS